MEIISNKTLKDFGFKKTGTFPSGERKKMADAIKEINFSDFDDYENIFEDKLASELQGRYTTKDGELKVFRDVKSQIKKAGQFKQAVDLYNKDLRIAIEVEKTKETTLLLDVVKFIIGNKRKKNNKPIIAYGVLVIPDRYRNKNDPKKKHGSKFLNRLRNELAFINTILFVKDILIVEYDTSTFFC